MLCKNTAAHAVEFKIDNEPGRPPTEYKVEGGEEVEIPDGYCVPYRGPTQRKMRPIISMICPFMRPMGSKSKGRANVTAPVGAIDEGATAAGLEKMLTALERLEKRLDASEKRNQALQRENSALRATSSDGGAAADVQTAADNGADAVTSPAPAITDVQAQLAARAAAVAKPAKAVKADAEKGA